MTEKRFTMDNPNDWGFPITDNVTGKVYSCNSNILMKDLCKVVNGIVDENEELKFNIDIRDKGIIELKEENEQLKSENNELQGKYDKQSSLFNGLGCEYDGLKAENEQLQQELFESENELLELYYHGNPVRRDQHLEVLKMEFKERFGRDFE